MHDLPNLTWMMSAWHARHEDFVEVADVALGAHTSILCSMANIGYQIRNEVVWDPKTYGCNSELGNKIANRFGRGEWKFT